MADVEKERKEQAKGPAAQAHELNELAAIYVSRGVSPWLAKKVRCNREARAFRFCSVLVILFAQGTAKILSTHLD